MENLIDLNLIEKSNNVNGIFKLSEKFTVFKTRYNGNYTKQNFLKRIQQNKNLYFDKQEQEDNSLLLFIDCEEFKSVDDYIISFYKKIKNIKTDYYAKSSWIYTQTNEFKMNWMHTHEYLHSSNKTNLKTQFTYVFYIQIPDNVIGNEGDIIFRTDDKKNFKYTPEENDILIFAGDIQHMAIPTPSAKIDRIVYATNVSYDFNYTIEKEKRVKFKNIIYKKIFGKSSDKLTGI